MCDVFGQDKLHHQDKLTPKSALPEQDGADLVEFVTQVDGIDVIAFKVGKHDDLGIWEHKPSARAQVSPAYKKHHHEQQSCCHDHRKEKQPC